MCGRFTLAVDPETLAEELGVPLEQVQDVPLRFNIAPTDSHFVVRMRREELEAFPARWGLVNSWAKDTKGAARNINARADSLSKRATFREAFEKRRCVVPADGFYEWVGVPKDRQPFWFHRPDGSLLFFAGLYEWRQSAGEWNATFTIITTDANELVADIHDRMPVVLDPGDVDRWLDPANPDPASLQPLLVPPPPDILVRRRVSRVVNSVKNEGPELIDEEPALL